LCCALPLRTKHHHVAMPKRPGTDLDGGAIKKACEDGSQINLDGFQKHAKWNGPVLIVGYGSIARGFLPLLLRHIELGPKSRITIVAPPPSAKGVGFAASADIDQHYSCVKTPIEVLTTGLTQQNYQGILDKYLGNGDPGFCVNLSVDVFSNEVGKHCSKIAALYIDTVNEPWLGTYDDPKLTAAQRSNYALREDTLKLKRELGPNAPTYVSCCGANPGMVSWFVKQALINLAKDCGMEPKQTPQSQQEWAGLAQQLGVKGIHIAERDTQRTKEPPEMGHFVNTWSVEGFIAEGCHQPAEAGWGTHEKKLPPRAAWTKEKLGEGCGASIYIDRPGAGTKVRSWTPTARAQHAFMVTHNESISISDYLTLRDEHGNVVYRPTCHYAYRPCDASVLALDDIAGAQWNAEKVIHKMTVAEWEEIADGIDELGVLLYGHQKNAYWYGSQLEHFHTRELAPLQNATALQVTSAVLAGMVWAIEHPRSGVVETDEIDFARCLEVQGKYIEPVVGEYTDWTPLTDRSLYFDEKVLVDLEDPWQFSNVLVDWS